ncbi:MAG TPA: hypothetical protein VF596_04615 [Pyrinomonadaceae bacterium]
MASNGSRTLIGVLLAAFSGAVVGLFILIGLIFLIPTGASNPNVSNAVNRASNSALTNKPTPSNISEPTPAPIEQTPTPDETDSPTPLPKTTFTPITLPTPAPKPNRTPDINPQTPGGGRTPKTLPKPSPKKPIPTPSVHT